MISLNERVQVRRIERGDAEAVALLAQQLGYARNAEQVLDWMEGLNEQHGRQIAFVACVGAEVVGWIEVSIERRLQTDAFGMIGGLVVSDRVRGRGIGRVLCERAEEWTWEQGLDILRVTSRSTRPGAHRFYLRDGYREVKTSLVFEKHGPQKQDRP